MHSSSPIHVLHVDDEPGFADMAAAHLGREDSHITIQTAENVEVALDIFTTSDFDCIISDYDMPRKNGIQFLHSVRASEPDIPFILFTGKGSEEIASDAISAGVTDYLQKEGGSGQYTLLANRIRNAVSQYHSRREIEAGQERLSMFFEQSPLGAIEWNENLDITSINETGETILGYHEDELVGHSWRHLIPEAEHRAFAEGLSEVASGSGSYNAEYEMVTKQGKRLICEWHHRTIRNDLDNVVTTFSKFQDVTERVERQQQLAQERAFTEQALNTLDDLFYVVDAEGTLQRWNDRLATELGYSDEELAGRNVRELFPEDHHSQIAQLIETSIDAGTASMEAAVLTANRGQVPYELTAKRLTDSDTGFLGIVGIGRDLSHQKEREQELEFTQDLLEKTEQIAEVGGWQVETATNEVYWSDHLFEMLGIDADEAPSLNEALNVYVEEDRATVEKAIGDAIASKDPFVVEARFERSDSSIRWFRIVGEPMVEAGEVVRLRGAVQDITDQKKRERQLEQFASVVSHDLRNPLSIAQGQLKLAAEECESTHLNKVQDAHERMETLISELLNQAKEGEKIGDADVIDFETFLGVCWETVDTGAATLNIETTHQLLGDRSRLKQLIENLFRNAVEHGGETVTVTVGDLDNGFYIEDDGGGIPEQERDAVLTRGYSTTETGTGYGLNIVKEIVDAHGWTVNVTESTDGGARFEFTNVEIRH